MIKEIASNNANNNIIINNKIIDQINDINDQINNEINKNSHNNWFSIFYDNFQEKSESYVDELKQSGCFNENDWKINFDIMKEKLEYDQYPWYNWIWNFIKNEFNKKTKFIKFRQLDIIFISKNILSLKHVTRMEIIQCNIEKLPNELTNLKNLKILFISNCPISNLPDNFDLLENLQQLDISNTYIDKMPKDINKLRNLIHLSFENNELEEFNFNELNLLNNKLQFLSLKGNQANIVFNKYDDTIENIKFTFESLKHLNLSQNIINEIDLSLFPNLEFLFISNTISDLSLNLKLNVLDKNNNVTNNINDNYNENYNENYDKLCFIDLSNIIIDKDDFDKLIKNSKCLKRLILRNTITKDKNNNDKIKNNDKVVSLKQEIIENNIIDKNNETQENLLINDKVVKNYDNINHNNDIHYNFIEMFNLNKQDWNLNYDILEKNTLPQYSASKLFQETMENNFPLNQEI